MKSAVIAFVAAVAVSGPAVAQTLDPIENALRWAEAYKRDPAGTFAYERAVTPDYSGQGYGTGSNAYLGSSGYSQTEEEARLRLLRAQAALLEAQRRALEQQQFQQNLDRMNTYWVPQFPQPAQQNFTCRVNNSPSIFGPTLSCN